MIKRILVILGIAENLAIALTLAMQYPYQFVSYGAITTCPSCLSAPYLDFLSLQYYFALIPALIDFGIWLVISFIAVFLTDFAWGRLRRGNTQN